MIDREFVDPREAYSVEEELAYEDNYEPTPEDFADFEDDGQPDEYTEWQDVYGGDDWDHGQFDMDEGWG